MGQYRKSNPARQRRIKRDDHLADHKGVAGLRVPTNSQPITTSDNVMDKADELISSEISSQTDVITNELSQPSVAASEIDDLVGNLSLEESADQGSSRT